MSGTGARHVNTAEEARSLAAHLLDGTRLRPCVVVSTAAGRAEPHADVDKILADVGDLGEVYLLATGEASWAFSNEMPEKTQAYGGASRAYPVDLSWSDDPLHSPLRFAYGRADHERVTDLLVGDALAMALSAGLIERHRAEVPTMPAAGEVLGVTGNRAIVTTDRGTGSIVPELTVEGVPAERLFARGCGSLGSGTPGSAASTSRPHSSRGQPCCGDIQRAGRSSVGSPASMTAAATSSWCPRQDLRASSAGGR